MLYGRSLSFCIQEAASGKINFTEFVINIVKLIGLITLKNVKNSL
jgi:hypothetical protein